MASKAEKRAMAAEMARDFVEDLKRTNSKAEASGAPKITKNEYDELRQTLAHKLVRER